MPYSTSVNNDGKVAVVGMAGRFPGAASVAELWQQSLQGETGIRATAASTDGNVPWRGVLDDVDLFDNSYFGVPEHEARIMDPQQRVLLEVAQHAVDDASLDVTTEGIISVFASCAPGPAPSATASLSEQYERELATSSDLAALRISYRLGLRGESITVQTGCSSSLVATHLACQSLLSGQSDASIVAGVSFPVDQHLGYPSEEGMISSPTGVCRPFSADADGAVPGGGAAAVVLKRLDDALAAGDRIYSVILSSAVNNDGQTKVGFMAPSPTGQSEVIATAHAVAGITAESIGYVETHGTATKLGDAVEIEGLRRAFSASATHDSACALGSVKANTGHLDRAAGVTGLIRASMALSEKTIPPMAGFTRPNPDLPFEMTGFYVPQAPEQWNGPHPLRAGVSAFGVGGTNAHVILEEAPRRISRPSPTVSAALLPISAKTYIATVNYQAALAEAVAESPIELASLALTLGELKSGERWRTFGIANGQSDIHSVLCDLPKAVESPTAPPRVVLAFPGQGEQVVDGLRELYEAEPVYKSALDECADIVERLAGFDIRTDMFDGDEDTRIELFRDMSRFQPAMFSTQWALAQLWKSWGVKADAVIGHSLGEITAATYAGVFELEDALATVVRRSQLFEEAPEGSTMTVGLGVDEVSRYLTAGVTIAAMNGADMTAVTGPTSEIENLVRRFGEDNVFHRLLNIRHSPHGPSMRHAGDQLTEHLSTFSLTPPSVAILSNVTGDWADDAMATAAYWGDQLCSPVRFVDQVARLGGLGETVVIEIGASAGLARLIAREAGVGVRRAIGLPSSKHDIDMGLIHRILTMVGEAWLEGLPVDFSAVLSVEADTIRLPPTQFDHSRRWPQLATRNHRVVTVEKEQDPGAWLYAPSSTRVTEAPPARTTAVVAHIGLDREVVAAISDRAAAAGFNLSIQGFEESGLSQNVTDVIWQPSARGSLLTEAARLSEMVSSSGSLARVWALAIDSPTTGGVYLGDLLTAASRVSPQEFPGVRWTAVRAAKPQFLVDGVFDLLRLSSPVSLYHLTSNGVAEITRKRAWPSWRSKPLRREGCYVITGGMGRVGRALAVAHALEVESTIVLLGRSSAQTMQAQLAELQKKVGSLGSNVLYQQVNVAERSEVAACFDKLRASYGRIDGVIHAAGETRTSNFALLADSDEGVIEALSRAKIEGARNIDGSLLEDDADFVILCSSLSVDLGGICFAAYVAANVALDDFAESKRKAGDARWQSIRWDAWSDESVSDSTLSRLALTDADGHEVYRRSLSFDGPVLTVSTADLDTRLAGVEDDLGLSTPGVEPGFVDSLVLQPDQLVRKVLVDVLGALPADDDRDLRADGLESLVLLQIISRLSKSIGQRIPLAAALRTLTVTGLVELVAGAQLNRKEAAVPRPGSAVAIGLEIGDSSPVSSVQRRWLELFPEGYGGIDIAVEVAGEGVSTHSLVLAVTNVVERHSGLRTTFHKVDSVWTQTIRDGRTVKVVDLSEADEVGAEFELGRLTQENCDAWFDLSETPPFEVTIIEMPNGRHIMLLHVHHVVFDGWSSSIFLEDVKRAIRGQLGDRSRQYVEHAVDQQAGMGGPAFLAAREHWAEHFKGSKGPTTIQADVGSGRDQRGKRCSLVLPSGTGLALRLQAEKVGVTPFVMMMAAFGLLLEEITGENDLVLGTTAAGRSEADTEDIVGVFVNPLPLRLMVDPEWTVRRYLAEVHEVLIGFHEFGNYPMEDLAFRTAPFIGMGLNDLFHCYILYQNYWRPTDDGITFRAIDTASSAHHKLMRDLEIVLEDTEDGLTAALWYRADLFSEKRASEWARRYEQILTRLATPTFNLNSTIDSMRNQQGQV